MTTADITSCPDCTTPDECGQVARCKRADCLARCITPTACRTHGCREAIAESNRHFAQPVSSPPPPPPRARILREAERLVCGDREADYGPPAESLARVAALWSAYLGQPVTAAQVCGCMALLKLGRLAYIPEHADSAADLAGYAALMHEVARDTAQPVTPASGPLSRANMTPSASEARP